MCEIYRLIVFENIKLGGRLVSDINTRKRTDTTEVYAILRNLYVFFQQPITNRKDDTSKRCIYVFKKIFTNKD